MKTLGTLHRVSTDAQSPPGARKESARANSRAALIEAAFGEFSAHGYEATTVAGIAERAGVTTGALYAHFSGKLELLLETVGLTPIPAMIRNVAAISSRPWSEAVRILGEAMAAEPGPHTILLLDAIVAARRDEAAGEVLRQGLDWYLAGMDRATEAGVAAGAFSPALEIDELNRILAVINLGMIAFGALGSRPPTAEAFSWLANLLFQSSETAGADRTPLDRVAARARALEEARAALAEATSEAAAEGHSLRQIGAAAGLSHERVRQLLSGAPDNPLSRRFGSGRR